MSKTTSSWIVLLAKTGLFAKGIVYCLIGLLAFMSAFHYKGQAASSSDRKGVIQNLLNLPGGRIILILIALGLLCYSTWRFIQAFLDTENKGKETKGLGKRLSYLFSGITYLSISFLAAKSVFKNSVNQGNSNKWIQTLMSNTWGFYIIIAVAIFFVCNGIYQIWYGLSQKYRKHIDIQELDEKMSASLLRAGLVGYTSRGIVWLLLGFLLGKATFHHKASEAGDTGSAFSLVQNSSYGSILLGILATGLICYGVTNFIRAGFEKVKN